MKNVQVIEPSNLIACRHIAYHNKFIDTHDNYNIYIYIFTENTAY